MSTLAATKSEAGSFLRSRLGSFLAVMPLGVWTLMHLWNNLSAFQGAEAWEASVTHHPHPLAQLVTSVVVLLPLALHTVWGISRLKSARPNIGSYGFLSNAKYLLQRLSALGLLGFLVAHLVKAWAQPRFVEGHAEGFEHIAAYMRHHTPTTIVYLLGTLAVSYHLANGLATFAMGWGIVSSRAALKKTDVLSYVLFVIFLGMSWGAVYGLWMQGAAFPAPVE